MNNAPTELGSGQGPRKPKPIEEDKGTPITKAGENSSSLITSALENKNSPGETPEATSEIPEYTFEGKEVRHWACIFSWNDTMDETREEQFTILSISQLKALLKDYTEKFPNWKEDAGKETAKNPIGLSLGMYWSSTEADEYHVRVINTHNGAIYGNGVKDDVFNYNSLCLQN